MPIIMLLHGHACQEFVHAASCTQDCGKGMVYNLMRTAYIIVLSVVTMHNFVVIQKLGQLKQTSNKVEWFLVNVIKRRQQHYHFRLGVYVTGMSICMLNIYDMLTCISELFDTDSNTAPL